VLCWSITWKAAQCS